MPFHHILVPVDTSGDNGPVVEIAAQLAHRQPDGVLVLLHVIETIDDAPEDEVREFYESLEQQARASMASLVDAMTAKPPTVEQRIAYGRRVPEILAAVLDCHADLVVVRSHRIDPALPGAGLGTLSHEVALLAEVPVLLVK
jgi:nucleotide-binding universal stress UspA family protein